MKNVTIRQLKIFIACSAQLSFSRAAEELHITAPAVSLQIKELEQDIGCPLFMRESRSVRLTQAGERFLVYALKIQTTLMQAEEALSQLQDTYYGSLTIGMVSTTRYFFPTVLVEFQKQFPQVQLKVAIKNRTQLIEQLHEGEIDLAIMGKPPSSFAGQMQRFALHPHVFVAPARHPMAQAENVPPQMLNQYEIITREQGSGTRYIMEKFFSKHHLTPKMRIEISGNETIKQAVIADLGVSLISMHTISQELKNGQLCVLKIQDTPIMREWYVVKPQKREPSKASLAFEAFILDHADRLFNQLFGNAA
jgi:LysR family transcriptional regulator, low CO2-responsive transcriptional regulator